MTRTLPSQEFSISKRRARHMHRSGPHVITTEAQTLDQALSIIAARQSAEKQSATRKSRPQTLRQELALARAMSSHKDVSLAGGVVAKGIGAKAMAKLHAGRAKPKIPHPYRDLPADEQPRKALGMFKSGAWGSGARGGRKLAQAFGVSHEQMAAWLGIDIWTAAEFNSVMVARKE